MAQENITEELTGKEAMEYIRDKSRKVLSSTLGTFCGGRMPTNSVILIFDDGSLLYMLFGSGFHSRLGYRLIKGVEA